MARADLLLAAPETDSILRFDGETGAELGAFVESGRGGLVDPIDPEFGPDGSLYVISNDPQNPSVLRFNGVDGSFVDTFVGAGVGGFDGGSAIAFGPNGDLYAASNTDAGVLRFNGATGAFVGVIGAGDVARASGLDFGPDGNLYVMDSDGFLNTFADRVLRYDPDSGELIDEFVAPGDLEDVALFSFGPDGHLYVPEVAATDVRRFNGTTGELDGLLVSGPPADGPAFDIVFGPDGNAYLSHEGGVQRVDSETGALVDEFLSGVAGTLTFFPEPPTDLVVVDFQVPPGAHEGTEFSFAYRVTSSATAMAPWVDAVYLSHDDVFDRDDLEIARIERAADLTPGADYTEEVTVDLPPVTPGEFFVFVVADRRGQVTDPTRANNISMSGPVEIAETPCLLDPEGTIAVGRTLSHWSGQDPGSDEVTIRYTVHNLGSCTIQDVLVSTELQPGIAVLDASLRPDSRGNELAWALGSVEAFGQASVEVTVARPAGQLNLDLGASAFGTASAQSVHDDVPPARLRADAIDPSLLSSTVDANIDDRFVAAAAARLDHDPARIFRFVAAQGFESYTGSLRGARGTLWSGAGNSLDQSSLLVAMLRSSGVPARYAHGTLADGDAQDVIRSMFPNTFRARGLISPDDQTADPANDQRLLGETRDHFWVQFDAGAGFVDADPVLPDAAIGQAFAPVEETFAEVPGQLRHKTTIRLDRELTNTASSLFGGSATQDVDTVLDVTFATAQLTGKPLSIGHFVSRQTQVTPIVTAFTNSYSPFLAVGDYGLDSRSDVPIRGTDYQEVITNFPFGTQIVTGLFLEVDLSGPDGTTETLQRTLVDLIGLDIRTNGGAPNLTFDADGPPTIGEFDVWTLNVLPGRHNRTVNERLAAEATRDFEAVDRQSDSGQTPFLLRDALVTQTRNALASYLSVSDMYTQQLADSTLVKAYFDQPRVTLVSASLTRTDENSSRLRFTVDLRRNAIRGVVYPGQGNSTLIPFQAARGALENSLETNLLRLNGPVGRLDVPTTVSTQTVFETASDLGISFVEITRRNLPVLDRLTISGEAKTRITGAVRGGLQVVVPEAPVELNGEPTTAWYEYNPETGELIGVTEDGGHQAIVEYASVIALGGLLNLFLASHSAGLVAAQVRVILFTAYELCVPHYAVRAPNDSPPLVEDDPTVVDDINDINRRIAKRKQCLEPLEKAAEDARDNFPRYLDFLSGFTFTQRMDQTIKDLQRKFARDDPPVTGPLLAPAETLFREHRISYERDVSATRSGGAVGGEVDVTTVRLDGQLSTSWQTRAQRLDFHHLTSSSATVLDASGTPVGTGDVSVASAETVSALLNGSANVAAAGAARMSVYADATTNLGVAGVWSDYSGTVSGTFELTFETSQLTLNGTALGSGVYTIVSSDASLAGTDAVLAPNFDSGITIDASGSNIRLGPGSGSLSVGGTNAALNGGLTLTGFDGQVTIQADTGSDTIHLDGTAEHSLQAVASHSSQTTDQNNPVTFDLSVLTTYDDTYDLAVDAPAGWRLVVEETRLIVHPRPGAAAGTYPLRLVAISQTRPDLIVGGEVSVVVTQSPPGLNLTVVPDPSFFVPVNGGQVHSAFEAELHNTGSNSDAFDLTVPVPPAGFEVQVSSDSLSVPGGERGLTGLYLSPAGALPAPGTDASFEVSATSQTDPGVTETVAIPFTVPEVHGVTLEALPALANTIPGVGVTVDLLVTAAGNVPEDVLLSLSVADGLTVDGLINVTLAPGTSETLTLIVTPDSQTPLNSTLRATITAEFGTPFPVSVNFDVRVAAPGAAAIANASTAALDLGNADLSQRLEELSVALTNKVQDPSSDVFRSQALSNLESVISLLAQEETLAGFVVPLSGARDQLAAAATPQQCLDAVVALGDVLDEFGATVEALAQHNVQLFLTPNTLIAQPQTPSPLTVTVINRGTQTTTYALTLSGVPADVTAQLDQTEVTLGPGEVVAVDGSLTVNSTTELAEFDFVVTATAAGVAPEISRSIPGSVQARNEVVSVVDVTADPPFADAGTQVHVAARLLNAVNRQQDALVTYTVADSSGTIVFTLPTPVPVTLSLQTSLVTVGLGTLETSDLVDGPHTINVSVTDSSGNPIPGATATGTLLIGSPVTANQDLTPDVLPPGTSVVTSSLDLSGVIPGDDPLTLVGQQAVPEATGVAVRSDVAYVCGSNGINVVDYSDPQAPTLVGTVGSGKHIGCLVQDDLLLSIRGFGAPFELHVFSIKNDPLVPVPLGNSEPINYGGVASGLMASGTHAFVTRFTWCHFLGSGDVFEHLGDMFSIALNLDDPINPTSASPALESVLFDTFGDASPAPGDIAGCPRSGGDHNIFGIALPETDTAYLAASTVTGTNTQDGVGIVQIVNIVDPAAPVLLQDFEIPGTVNAVGVAVEGTTAVVIGTTGGWHDPVPPGLLSGNLTLTTLDITNVRDPQILAHRTLDRGARTFWNNMASLGDGLFSFASMDFDSGDGNGEILLIDAANPRNPFVVRSPVQLDAAQPNSLAGDDGLLFTSDAAGLVIYEVGELPGVPVTARIQLPSDAGVEVVNESFNIPPSQVVPGVDFDTLIWDLTLTPGFETRTLSFDATVTDLQPGESRDVTSGATIEFSFAGAPGEIMLPAQSVVAEQILSLAPASRTVQPGEDADYTLTIDNPAAAEVTYDLSASGVPSSWVGLTSVVTVPAGTSVDVPLTLTSDPFAIDSDYGFVVSASTNGVTGSVAGTLILLGAPLLPTPQPDSRGVVLALEPQHQTTGQGTLTTYRARITNTGSQTDTFDLSITGLPAQIEAVFSRTSIEVPPGASNFREVTFMLTAAPGTAADDYTFTVHADSTDDTVSDTADGLLTVLGLGVDVDLQPIPGLFPRSSGGPQQYRLVVTNTGAVRETYDLDLGAPVALVAELRDTSVTLEPGESQSVDIDVGPIDFAFPGVLSLVGMATARSDASVTDADQELLTITGERDLEASFVLDSVELERPGTAPLRLVIENLGNLEDEYRVQILSTSGPLQASLRDLSGQSVQSIPLLILPGLSEGVLTVNTVLTAAGAGTVSVLVGSLQDPSLSRTVTATVTTDQAVLSIEDASIVEGDDGQRSLEFTVRRDTVSGSPSVSWSTADGTAVAGQDYVASLGTVDFVPGGSLTQTVTVPITGDELVELDETFDVALSAPQGGTIANGTATGSIVNDDRAAIRINNFASVEGNDGSTVFRFNVRIDNAVDVPLTLTAGTEAGTARSGSDYQELVDVPLTLQSSPQAGAIVPLEVMVHGDMTIERRERFFVNLQVVDFAGRDVVISDSRGRGTIRNDDAPPTCASRPFGIRIEDRQLIIVGTDDDDEIDVRESDSGVEVELNDEERDFASGLIDRILICALGGDDDVDREGNSRLPAQIEGGAGDDEIDGGRGPDLILGGPGNDDIEGGGSGDELFGGSGQDELQGDTGHDFLHGGSSRDRLEGGPGDDILIGNAGADELIGDQGNDLLDGGRGHDVLDGEADRDILIGGDGADELDGDSDEDILIPGRLLFAAGSRELAAILREWTSDRSLSDRTDNLRGVGTGPRFNSAAFLTVENGDPGTVFDDGFEDVLRGNEDADWFFASAIDVVTDHDLFEELDTL